MINANPLGKTSRIVTLVAVTLEVWFKPIVNLTKVLLPIKVTLAVLIIVALTGRTSTVALSPIIVAFSLHDAETVLFHLPTAFDLATIHS